MIDHITIRVSDINASKLFYMKALAPVGYVVGYENDRSIGFCSSNKKDFWIIEDETKNVQHSFSCLAFGAASIEAVDAFYQAANASGGKCNGAPGYRLKYHPGYYAAFVLDPDGHNIEAIFDDWKKAEEGR